MKNDQAFDQDGERQNPWWGDPSYRIIPKDATFNDIRMYHLLVNPKLVEEDLNCLLPMAHLQTLAETGEIGEVAESHYSIMGYLLKPEIMLKESVPAIVTQMRAEAVDVVLLVPD